MHRILRRLLFFALLAIVLPSTAAAQVSVEEVTNPRQTNRWVTDEAGVLNSTEKQRLNGIIEQIHQEQGVEIAVVTVYSVDTATPKDFATELFNYWGIGDDRSDNGLLVLMVMSENRLEMETGYGTEAVLTDGWLKSMQMDVMIPRFKKGDFGGGLIAGVERSIERLRQYPNGIPEGMAADPYDDGELPVPWWFLLGGGVFGLGGAGAFWKHRRDRTCEVCGERMTMLPEDEDDAYLSEGEQMEEAIGSIDYQYWYCEEDDFDRMLTVKKWFSGYGNCPACQHRTLSSHSQTIRAATYSSSGTRRVTRDCAHCDYHDVRHHTIPRKTRSSSSSGGGGGGGSSFGGGSSGGGGAGSSW